MTLIRVTAPAVPAIARQQVWDHLPLDYEAGSPLVEPFDAAMVDEYIESAVSHIDGDDGWLGRALITQTWDYTTDGFPGDPKGCIGIPLPPLQEVVSVHYIDGHGQLQELPSSQYRVTGGSGWSPARIIPAFGTCWPPAPCRREGVTMRFIAGYGDDPSKVPPAIRQALRLLVGAWYRNREDIITGTIVAKLPNGVESLLQPFRVWR